MPQALVVGFFEEGRVLGRQQFRTCGDLLAAGMADAMDLSCTFFRAMACEGYRVAGGRRGGGGPRVCFATIVGRLLTTHPPKAL